MRPSTNVDGDIQEPSSRSWRLLASMRPSTNVDGDLTEGYRSTAELAGFNEAVDERRRRPPEAMVTAIGHVASMRPSTNVDGDAPSQRDPHASTAWLQ